MRFWLRKLLHLIVCISMLNLIYMILSNITLTDTNRESLQFDLNQQWILSNHSINATKEYTIRKCTVAERAAYLTQKCQTFGKETRKPVPRALKRIYVDEAHKVMLCVPYKVGASTHLNLLAQNSAAYLSHKMPKSVVEERLNKLVDSKNRRSFGIRELSSFGKTAGTAMLEEYFKVAVVRHPFVRLLSMYMNKVATFSEGIWKCSSNYYGEDLTKYLDNKYPHQSVQNCTFAAFIERFVQHKDSMLKDMHLFPMHSWCYHCRVKYDMLIRLETGDSDQQYLLLNKLNSHFNRTIHINSALKTSQNKTEETNFMQLWTQYAEVKPAHIKELEQMYYNDLALFGYSYNFHDASMQTSCAIDLNGDKTDLCC